MNAKLSFRKKFVYIKSPSPFMVYFHGAAPEQFALENKMIPLSKVFLFGASL